MDLADTILITGAGGFIGSAVSHRFSSHGHHVRASSRNPAAVAGRFDEIAAMPPVGSDAQAWDTLLDGVTHVVHCAGIAHAGGGVPEAVYWDANVRLTAELASAAAARIPGKFIFVSSIRAVCGPTFDGVVTATTKPNPQGAYGRSKLEAERQVRNAFNATGRFTILRPVLVYGPGAKGNLSALLRLARLPLPLPLAGLSAKRSLLDLKACAAAVEHVVFSPRTNGATYLVSDCNPLSTTQIVAAFRRGLGRRVGLFAVPPALLSALFGAIGKQQAWRRLSGSLVADPSELAATGWRPVNDSAAGLEHIASRIR
jgi:UDP-glucose 4-epimerase